MDDDLNTAGAVAVLHELAGDLNRAASDVVAAVAADRPDGAGRSTSEAPDIDECRARAATLATTLRTLGGRLGLLQEDPEAVLRGELDPGSEAADGLSDAAIDALIEERRAAREAKDFVRGDAIRDRLAEEGIVLEDAGGSTSWRRD